MASLALASPWPLPRPGSPWLHVGLGLGLDEESFRASFKGCYEGYPLNPKPYHRGCYKGSSTHVIEFGLTLVPA